VPLAVGAFRVWRQGAGSVVRRYYLGTVAVAAVGFLWFLNSWNVLGFRF
jgi:hypothetical protein